MTSSVYQTRQLIEKTVMPCNALYGFVTYLTEYALTFTFNTGISSDLRMLHRP